MAGIVCLVCRNCEQRWVIWYVGSLSNFIAEECGRYGFDLFYVEGCGVSSVEYRVHLVSV